MMSRSNLHRLRNKLLIILYHNAKGKRECTIQEIFQPFSKKLSIRQQDIIKIGQHDEAIREIVNDLLFQYNCGHVSQAHRMNDSTDDTIPLTFIVSFLEDIKSPEIITTIDNRVKGLGIYHQVMRYLHYDRPRYCSAPFQTSDVPSTTIDENIDDLLKDENDQDKKRASTSSSPYPKGRSILKKHETVIQERIIKHMIIEEDGTAHESIESDKNQNDTIHVECKTGSYFAHREYTQQEQVQELDGETVSFAKATEDYVHFKNKEDEFEYVYSDIPNSRNEDNEDWSTSSSSSSSLSYNKAKGNIITKGTPYIESIFASSVNC